MDFLDYGPEKPVRIWSRIGRRPILSCGNSNGDLPMPAWSGRDSAPALRMLILHDDADREFDYTAGAEQVLALDLEEPESAVEHIAGVSSSGFVRESFAVSIHHRAELGQGENEAKQRAADQNVMFDQWGERAENERREVKPPRLVESAPWFPGGRARLLGPGRL